MRKQLYLVRGLPGSGKSTLAKQLTGNGGVHCEADQFFTLGDGTYIFNADNLGAAHSACQTRVREAMDAEMTPIIVANTFSCRWEMAPYLLLATRYAYEVTVLEVQTELSNEQLAGRTVHGVPVAVIAKMRSRWETL